MFLRGTAPTSEQEQRESPKQTGPELFQTFTSSVRTVEEFTGSSAIQLSLSKKIHIDFLIRNKPPRSPEKPVIPVTALPKHVKTQKPKEEHTWMTIRQDETL